MSHRTISTILRHDGKQTSYKIALLRALNDVVLAYPDVGRDGRDVAVPLRALAEAWVAYFWPFVAPGAPVVQGVRSLLAGELRQDVGFRAHLAELRGEWETVYGPSGAAGGWRLVEHLRVARKRAGYPAALLTRYRGTLSRIATALRQPIRYAGPGEWTVFARPRPLREHAGVEALPGARLAKLVEEASEAAAAGDAEVLALELADVFEVIDAVLEAHGLDADAVRALQARRREERGGSRGGSSCGGRRGERRRAGDHPETRSRSPSARITF